MLSMDCFIKKIFDSNGKEIQDELVHLQFQKFSRGEFKDKAALILNKTKGLYSLSTTPEYGNEFVRVLAEKLGDRKTPITGILVSTRDLSTQELNYQSKKQFMGVKQYVLQGEMSGKQILELCSKYPASFLGLSFKVDSNELKIKPKAPKSAKPSTKSEETVKADFCKLYTSDKDLIKKFIFDSEINLDNFKKTEIKHIFNITDIIVPKNEKDFARMRELAKRKGKIIRILRTEEKETRKEVDFLA